MGLDMTAPLPVIIATIGGWIIAVNERRELKSGIGASAALLKRIIRNQLLESCNKDEHDHLFDITPPEKVSFD